MNQSLLLALIAVAIILAVFIVFYSPDRDSQDASQDASQDLLQHASAVKGGKSQFVIQSVATGMYMGDKGFDASTPDEATFFTLTPTKNLATGAETWSLKLADYNGKYMLTNDDGSAAYVVNQVTEGGGSAPVNPFVPIPSVQSALGPQTRSMFEVIPKTIF